MAAGHAWALVSRVRACEHIGVKLRVAACCIVLGSIACAHGPHPAVTLAAKEFACEPKAITLHELYPRKVRVEGCGKEATYVKICQGYGIDAKCGWAIKPDEP